MHRYECRLTKPVCHRISARARRPDGRRRVPQGPRGRKVRAPRKRGAGQRPAGATPGKVPQKTYRRHRLRALPARVKRCGKSAPRARQRAWQGKPHREQDRIGAAGGASRQGRFRPAARVGRMRRVARRVLEEWPSRSPGEISRADRTRLTGRLATIFGTSRLGLIRHALGNIRAASGTKHERCPGQRDGQGDGQRDIAERCGRVFQATLKNRST